MTRSTTLSVIAAVILTIALQGCSPASSPTQEVRRSTAEASTATLAGPFIGNSAEPFGTYDGVPFVRHTGFFEGETSLGAFRMPYEIVAPENPELGNGTVLVEPPHFQTGTVGRDVVLGRDLVFRTVSGYATVGFGENGRNILDLGASDLLLAGEPVEKPGVIKPTGIVDEEILIQFAQELKTAPSMQEFLGEVDQLYAYGLSQSADALMESQRNLAQRAEQGPFDLTLLHTATWNPQVPPDIAADFDLLGNEFEPLDGVGKVIFIETEGDLLISDAEQFREAAGETNYRLYEVAGADHSPLETNPLDHSAVARALFVAGDRWVRSGTEPPPSTLIEPAAPGEVDPVYGEETGIARDGDLNALGGVRLPDLAVGRAQFIASDPATSVPRMPPALAFLSGSVVDLAREPEPGSGTGEPRFGSHDEYLSAFTVQVDRLQQQGFLLEADARALKERAAASDVGRPGTED